MYKLIKTYGLIVVLSFNLSALLAKSEPENPWTDCGLGAMLFPSHGVGATISNIIWDLGTTAVTSYATTPDACKGEKASAAAFIYESYNNIEEETAIGSGEYLTAMLNILHCDTSIHESIIGDIRSEFAQSVGQQDYESKPLLDKAKGYYNILDNKVSSTYSKQCKAI